MAIRIYLHLILRLKSLRADNRNRTCNLLITNQLLCQLSYVSISAGYAGFEPANAGVKVLCLTSLANTQYTIMYYVFLHKSTEWESNPRPQLGRLIY